MVCWTEKISAKKLLAMKRAVCSLNFNVITHLSHLANLLYSTWRLIDSCGIRKGTTIPKPKSVNQSFHITAECAFLYAGLHTYLALQVNVTENNRILRDVGTKNMAAMLSSSPFFTRPCVTKTNERRISSSLKFTDSPVNPVKPSMRKTHGS